MRLLALLLAVSLPLAGTPATSASGSDPYLGEQWQEASSGIERLRAAGGDGEGVTVGLVDGGYDLSHPDLDGIDLLYLPPASGSPFATSHGTGILGVLAAERGNAIGIAGVAPKVRVIARAAGEEDDARIVEYLDDLADRGARIVGLSLGYQAAVSGDALVRAYERLRDRGVLVVGAAGNFGEADIRIYPSRLDAAISVGAHGPDGRLASFSNRTGVTLTAPGVGIVTTDDDGGYEARSGTSLATPIVVGVLAGLLSLDRSLDVEGALALLLESGERDADGLLRLDVGGAVELLLAGTPVARITELPKLPRSSLAQPVTIRTGRVGDTGGCRLRLTLGTRSIEMPCAPAETLSLGELLDRLEAEGRAGRIEIVLESEFAAGDRGAIAFDLDAPPYDPEPDDLRPPRLDPLLGAKFLVAPSGEGRLEVRFSDDRGLRPGEAFCSEIASRSRGVDGAVSGWGRQVDESADYAYRVDADSLVLRLSGIRAASPGRLEWRIDCADSSGNFAPPTIASLAVPLEGASLAWDLGGRRLDDAGSRGGDLAATERDGATIEWEAWGTHLALIGRVGPGLGRIELTIDGGASCEIDLAAHPDGRPRQARSRALLIGPGMRCGGLPLGRLSETLVAHRVTLRALIDRPGLVVPIDAIAIW